MYMAGEMALYLLQKVARGDFHYWIPIDVQGLILYYCGRRRVHPEYVPQE